MRFAYLGSLVLLLPASLSLSVDNEIKYTDAAISDQVVYLNQLYLTLMILCRWGSPAQHTSDSRAASQVLSLPGADALAITFNQFSGEAFDSSRRMYKSTWRR
jgi:hypothetical protein